MRLFNHRAFVLIFLFTVTFYSCEQVKPRVEYRTAKGDVSLGGKLTVAVPKLDMKFLPSDLTDATSTEIGQQIHACLVSLDPKTLEVIPSVAQGWSTDEAGNSLVFVLRTGVKFHSDPCFGNAAREVTARDFVYSFHQLCAPGSEAFNSTFLNRVKGANEFNDGSAKEILGVVAIDDYTLKIELLKPDPSFLFVLAQPSTAVVSEKAVEKYGKDCKVGAGAFEVAATENDLTLTRNPEYFLQDEFGNRFPYIDTLVVKAISAKDQQLEAFFSGQVDLVSGLYLDPVRAILDKHMSDFSGNKPAYIMERESESVGFETYCIYRAEVKGLGNNFMGYRDFSRVQLRQ